MANLGNFADATPIDVCQASEDLSDEEKAIEILPIRVQQLYVLTRLGKVDEANALAGQISSQEYGACRSTIMPSIDEMTERQIFQPSRYCATTW